MNLKELAKKPKLIKVEVTDDVVVNAYGESVEFWMYDRQDLPTFLKFANLKENTAELSSILRDLVLDERGKPLLEEGAVLPFEIVVPVIEAVIQRLGNSIPQTSPS